MFQHYSDSTLFVVVLDSCTRAAYTRVWSAQTKVTGINFAISVIYFVHSEDTWQPAVKPLPTWVTSQDSRLFPSPSLSRWVTAPPKLAWIYKTFFTRNFCNQRYLKYSPIHNYSPLANEDEDHYEVEAIDETVDMVVESISSKNWGYQNGCS